MTVSKALLTSTFLLLALLYLAEGETKLQVSISVADKSFPQIIDCGAACAGRCRLSSRPNLCKRACGTCCARCGCVPPGTSGNLDVCPCYANMTTHGNRRKCP